MNRTEFLEKKASTGVNGLEIISQHSISDLKGQPLNNGDVVILHREPYKNKRAKIIIDLITDNKKDWFVYQLVSDSSIIIDHGFMWEGLKDYTQKVVKIKKKITNG